MCINSGGFVLMLTLTTGFEMLPIMMCHPSLDLMKGSFTRLEKL